MPTFEERLEIPVEHEAIAGTMVTPGTLVPGVLFIHGWGGNQQQYLIRARDVATLAPGRSLRDHLSHMLVHGLLHLLGFDHESEDQAEEMEDFERRILARLGIEDPYSGTVPVEDLSISP